MTVNEEAETKSRFVAAAKANAAATLKRVRAIESEQRELARRAAPGKNSSAMGTQTKLFQPR